MRAGDHLGILAVFLLLAAPLFSQAQTSVPDNGSPSSGQKQWSFDFTTTGYVVPHDRSYVSPTFSADRQSWHAEARYNYEDKETGSLWVGYNLSAGEKLTLEVTPMLGGVFGNTTGIAPGFRFALTYNKLELSSEGEYVFDTGNKSSNFFYCWNELTYSPVDWFHTGLVSQRSRAYHTELDVQRGISFGFSRNKLDFTTYILNAGWTDPTFVLSLGFTF